MTYFTKDFLENIKRAAKDERKISNLGNHSDYLNSIAKNSGYQHWPLLQRKMQESDFISMEHQHKINKSLVNLLPNSIEKYITVELRQFLNSNFEPLESYSMPNSESSNGYSHPSIDINVEINATYENTFPKALLDNAITVLQNKYAGWCEDDGEIMFENDYPASFSGL
ncbi:MAG: hypothetical protein GQ547_00845 [Methylophaga sp.]|nr:hypothetical protein [Methylophaga sp.]